MTDTKHPPEPKTTPSGEQCHCGCCEIPKRPESNFQPGHDARVKGMLSKPEKGTAEPEIRFPDAMVRLAANDPKLAVDGYDTAAILATPLFAPTHSESEPNVLYFPDTRTLVIENGERRAEGEHVAKGVMVFYAATEGAELDHVVSGITIENAEMTLKPFVDALLAKYGVQPKQPADAGLAQTL